MRFNEIFIFFFQAEDGIRDLYVTGVQTCALPISRKSGLRRWASRCSLPVKTLAASMRTSAEDFVGSSSSRCSTPENTAKLPCTVATIACRAAKPSRVCTVSRSQLPVRLSRCVVSVMWYLQAGRLNYLKPELLYVQICSGASARAGEAVGMARAEDVA